MIFITAVMVAVSLELDIRELHGGAVMFITAIIDGYYWDVIIITVVAIVTAVTIFLAVHRSLHGLAVFAVTAVIGMMARS